jgi:signal transduction histidine kinase
MSTRHLTRIAVKLIKWVTHPVVVFVALQIVWITILVLWVFWFLNQQETLARLTKIIGAATPFSPATGIFTLVVGCVLLGIILVGTVVLFVFTQIQSSLLRQQKSFVSSVTHELRSPLSSLQLSFETLQRRQLPQDIRDRIFGMVEKDLERLAQLVERILIAGRLDRGMVDYKAQQDEIALRELLEHSVSQLGHLDPEAQKRITIDCSSTLIISSSRLGLNMVVGNLLENALKYSPASSPIHVRVQIKEYELWICFEDKGLGLSKNEQRKIFRMFHRSPSAEKRAVPGTGIGLYIVRSVVQSLGGRVWAQSEGLGKGSLFTVAFSRECILSY